MNNDLKHFLLSFTASLASMLVLSLIMQRMAEMKLKAASGTASTGSQAAPPTVTSHAPTAVNGFFA